MALRLGDWKLVRNGDLNRTGGPWPESFFGNLVTDPRETTDLSERLPGQRERFEARLESWFEGIKREAHTFAPPEHQIPESGSASILASHACHVDPSLYNNVPATEGFDRPGQTVRWSLHAAAAREFHPELVWFRGGTLPAGSRLALRCSGSEVIGRAGPSGEVAWDEALSVDGGPGTLELEILEIPPPDEPLDLLFVNLLPEQ